MTKNDFIHRAIIAQMANPHAWGGDGNILNMSPSDIIDKAQDMADYVEQEGIPFDALPMEEEPKHNEEDKKEHLDRLDFGIEHYKEMLRSAPKDFCETKDGQDWCEHINSKLARLYEERDKLVHELES